MDHAHAALAALQGLAHEGGERVARLVAAQAVQVDLRLDGPLAAAQPRHHVGGQAWAAKAQRRRR